MPHTQYVCALFGTSFGPPVLTKACRTFYRVQGDRTIGFSVIPVATRSPNTVDCRFSAPDTAADFANPLRCLQRLSHGFEALLNRFYGAQIGAASKRKRKAMTTARVITPKPHFQQGGSLPQWVPFKRLKQRTSQVFCENFLGMLKTCPQVSGRFDKTSDYRYSTHIALALDDRTDSDSLKLLCTDKNGLTISIVTSEDMWNRQQQLMIWTQMPDDEDEGVEVDFFLVRQEASKYVLTCSKIKAPSVCSLHAKTSFETMLSDLF